MTAAAAPAPASSGFSLANLISALSGLMGIAAMVDPDPVSKAALMAAPLAYSLVTSIVDPAAKQANFESSMQVAAAVASSTLTGGAKNTYSTVIAPVLPALTQSLEQAFGMTNAALQTVPDPVKNG